MQYRVQRDNGDDYVTQSIDDVIDYCISDDYHTEDDDYFQEWVNDNYSGTTINGVDYYAYDILEKFDNLSDVLDLYVESENDHDTENAEYELRHAIDGETIYIQNYEVICEEIDVESDCVDPDDQEREDYLKLFQTIG